MIAPPAMLIYVAIDQLKDPAYVAENLPMLTAQMKELNEALGGSQPEPFHAGYQLGLQTARVLLAGMPAAVFNKVSI